MSRPKKYAAKMSTRSIYCSAEEYIAVKKYLKRYRTKNQVHKNKPQTDPELAVTNLFDIDASDK